MVSSALALAFTPSSAGLLYAGYYLVYALFLYYLADRLDHEMPWLAFVPVANLWLLLDLGGLPWWLLGLLIFRPWGALAFMVALGLAGVSIADRMGKPLWTGALVGVPVLNLVFLAWLAFSD